MRGIKIQLKGEQGIFQTKKDITLHFQFLEKNDVPNALKAIRKELGNFKSVVIDILYLGNDYSYIEPDNVKRIIVSPFFPIKVRQFNGRDFGDIYEEFESDSTRKNRDYIMKYIKEELERLLAIEFPDGVPEKSRYAQTLA